MDGLVNFYDENDVHIENVVYSGKLVRGHTVSLYKFDNETLTDTESDIESNINLTKRFYIGTEDNRKEKTDYFVRHVARGGDTTSGILCHEFSDTLLENKLFYFIRVVEN